MRQRQRRREMETATSYIRQRYRTIRMAEAEMRDGENGGGSERQERHRLIRTSESYTLDDRDSG